MTENGKMISDLTSPVASLELLENPPAPNYRLMEVTQALPEQS